MDNAQPAESEPKKDSHFPWRTFFLSIVLIVIASFAYSFCSKTGTVVIGIAEKFKTGTITHTFREGIPEITTTHGDVLEVATSRNDETFTRSDSKKILWNALYLGTTVSEIRVPSTFRYHIRLSDAWRLASSNNVCIVQAPSIRASLPTAIQTDQMEKSTSSGWARFDKNDNLGALERSITPELDQRASDAQHINLIREACRQSIADFVKKWLMKEDHWRNDRFSSIVVKFPDEANINSDEDLEQYTYAATVKLD